ncbi:MAG TPA: DNA gyrase inhibitor YacG [Alphaproteobacteria bacterium]|nr:DNA gyrase inhibitor YacG [Alphaproteobacteria bacterium]HAJ48159.1 DNA gyrase inhibitor YacG [Alphaproteobacteria bacterium]
MVSASKPGAGSCPVCAKPRDTKFKPFCSKRCADVDLNRWLSGNYAIPASPDDDAQDSGEADGKP